MIERNSELPDTADIVRCEHCGHCVELSNKKKKNGIDYICNRPFEALTEVMPWWFCYHGIRKQNPDAGDGNQS